MTKDKTEMEGTTIMINRQSIKRWKKYSNRSAAIHICILALAMTIALLIQDTMGDFYSSMFVTSGVFGLVMYLAGMISIVLYKPLLPVPVKTD